MRRPRRAHAGLSFVHFQTAFMRHSDDLAGEIALARRFAIRGLSWLERATSISPNYAQGIYARAWSEALAGRGRDGRRHVDFAMRLSPLDPLYYGMLGTRSFTHMVCGDQIRAATWAVNVRWRNSSLTRADFFRAMPMKPEATRARVSAALGRFGF